MNSKALSQHLKQLIASDVWKEIEVIWTMQREAILHKGKKNRKDEAGIKCWAELDGFDKCRSVIYRMSEYQENKTEVE